MFNEVVCQVAHYLAHSFLFRVRIGDQVIIGGIEEIMAVQFVGTGIAFPIPFSVAAFRPARLIEFPEGILLLAVLLVAFQASFIGVRAVCGKNRARHVALGRFVFAGLCDGLQKAQRFKGALRAIFGERVFGGGIGKALARAVHGRPKPIIVAVRQHDFRFVARFGQSDFGHIAIGCAPNIFFQFVFVKSGFFGKRHILVANPADTAIRGDPDASILVGDHAAHFVARQPAFPLAVAPQPVLVPNSADFGAKPHRTVAASGHAGKIIVRQAFLAREELPAVCLAACRACKGGKPQVSLCVHSHAAHIVGAPLPPHAVLHNRLFIRAGIITQIQPVSGGQRNRCISVASSLAHHKGIRCNLFFRQCHQCQIAVLFR